MAELIDDLRRRVLAAERVCYLFGITSARHETERDKAVTQAWMDWSAAFNDDVPRVTDEEITELARRRDEIRAATLRRIRGGPDA